MIRNKIRYLLWRSSAQFLDRVLGIGSQEDDHWIELGVVELVDSAWCYVEECVPSFLY